jgi:hypothetical protein
MDGDLVVRCHQVDLAEDGTPEMLVRVIVDMTDEVAVWDCPSVDYSVVVTGTPPIVLFGYDV